MKRSISITLVVIVLTLLLTGCGAKTATSDQVTEVEANKLIVELVNLTSQSLGTEGREELEELLASNKEVVEAISQGKLGDNYQATFSWMLKEAYASTASTGERVEDTLGGFGSWLHTVIDGGSEAVKGLWEQGRELIFGD